MRGSEEGAVEWMLGSGRMGAPNMVDGDGDQRL